MKKRYPATYFNTGGEMKNQKIIIYEDTDFESYKIDNIGVIKIKSNVFEIITDLPESSKFMQAMSNFEKDPKNEIIMILNEGSCFGTEAYNSYLSTLFSTDEQEKSHLRLSNRLTRTRELVILNSIIRKIVNSEKLVVSALQGEIVTPFFGTSLASDIRIVAENVCFKLSHVKMNIHPSGGLPYFLPKYIGLAKASQILYGKDVLSIRDAFDLGLIHKIISEDNFENLCIEEVKQIALRGQNSIRCTKKLLNIENSQLDKYLNIEECDFKF